MVLRDRPIKLAGGTVNANYFGDSYDIVKRFLLATLRPLGGWSVHPMFTKDRRPTGGGPFVPSEFVALVGAPLVSERFMEDETRESFEASCKAASHLLLDPDTGISKRGVRPTAAHVSPEEIERIVKARPKFVTAIYDQSFTRGPDTSRLLLEKLNGFAACGFHGFAYDSHARFLFLSATRRELETARTLLREAGLPESRLLRAR